MKSTAQKVIRLYYGFQFFFPLFLWLPIFYEYQKKIGLDDSQIFLIQSIYYWVFCLLEIPTGLIADRFGYRFCMRAGAIWVGVAGLFPIFFQSYSGFLVHFLLIALGRSFVSGAASAYLYEFLKLQGNSDYKKVEGNARAYSLIGKIVLWPAVGALMHWHLTLPYWLTFFANGVGVWLAFSFPCLEWIKRDSDFLKNIRGTFSVLLFRPLLVLIMIQGVAVFTLSRILQINLFQPILISKGIALGTHGAVMSFMTVFETWGSFTPTMGLRSKGPFSNLSAVFLFTLLMAGSMIWIDFSGVAGTWIALGVFSYVTGASFPVQKQLINDAIPDSKYRATLLSVESIVDRAACAMAASFVASFVAQGKVGAFLRISGFAAMGLMVLLYLGLHFATSRSELSSNALARDLKG